MTHPLDNPVWHALVTGNKDISFGDEQARYLDREIGLFAGMKNYGESDFRHLDARSPFKGPVILFTPAKVSIPAAWKTLSGSRLLQLVYPHPAPPAAAGQQLVALQEKDVPAMLALTALTKPGPFLTGTITLGDYYGIFAGDRLVAMTGVRLQPDPYTEISAVCTHPDHGGKGYASKLVCNQISSILAAGRIPFLHVMPENTPAVNMYQKLGFQIRKELMVYGIEKNTGY